MEISWDEAGIELQWINIENKQSHCYIYTWGPCALKALLALQSSSITLVSTNKTHLFAQHDLLRTKKYSNPVLCKQPGFPFQSCELVTYRCWLSLFDKNNVKCSSGRKKCRLWPHINPISMVLTFDFNSGTVLGIFKSRTKWKEMLNTFLFLLKTGTII